MFFKIIILILIIIILLLIFFLGNVIESNIELNFEYNNLYYNNKIIDIKNIEEYINYKENLINHLDLNKKKEIVWFENKNEKTDFVIYFLHGFNSNKLEGKTYSIQLAKETKSNLLLARLPGNGVYNKETSYNNLNFYNYLRDIYDDLILLSILGNKIILIGSSTGCTYNIIASSIFKKFNIYKNIFFSPNLGLNFYTNIGVNLLSYGYGKSIIKLTTDKIKIDNNIITPDVFLPLIGSLKAYNSIKNNFNNDFIIFVSENDELVSNSKINNFFKNIENVKKHYYIFKNEKVHPILFLKNSNNLFIEKTLYFLNNYTEKIIKTYL